MDEYRDKVFEQRFSNWQMEEQIAKLEKETKYAEMTYNTFMKSKGQDSIAMAQVAIDIEKMKIKELTENTLEWYNAKMSLLQMEVDLANSMRENTKMIKDQLSQAAKELLAIGTVKQVSGLSSVIAMQGVSEQYFDLRDSYDKTKQDALLAKYGAMERYDTGQTRDVLLGTYFNPIKSNLNTAASSKGFGTYTLQQLKEPENVIPEGTTWTKQINYAAGEYLPSNLRASIRDGNTVQSPAGTLYEYYKTEPIMGEKWDITIDEIRELVEEDIQNIIDNYTQDIKTIKTKQDIRSRIYQFDDAISGRYNDLFLTESAMAQMNTAGYFETNEYELIQKEFTNSVLDFYSDMSTDISNVLKAGFIDEKLNTALKSFVNGIENGLDDSMVTYYEEIMMVGRKMVGRSSVLDRIKDMEDFSIFNEVIQSKEMSSYKKALGILNPGEFYNSPTQEYKMIGDTMQLVTSEPNYADFVGSAKDPYSAWFDFNKQVIQTRISNAEYQSDEWFAAQNDLFNLMIENAEKLKEKAENMTRSIEDMLGKIEETMRMRIAEEKQTTKGDVYFVDVGSTRNSQQMLDRMLASVKSNDPEAMKLIEEFKKKMLGIGR